MNVLGSLSGILSQQRQSSRSRKMVSQLQLNSTEWFLGIGQKFGNVRAVAGDSLGMLQTELVGHSHMCPEY